MGYRAPTLLLPLYSCRCHFIAKYGSSGSGFMTGLRILCVPMTAKDPNAGNPICPRLRIHIVGGS
jgi:hypothetical protein